MSSAEARTTAGTTTEAQTTAGTSAEAPPVGTTTDATDEASTTANAMAIAETEAPKAPAATTTGLGAWLTLATFIAGIVLGALVYIVLNQRPPVAPFPTVSTVAEPAAAAEVASAIARDDAPALARNLDSDRLTQLGELINPLVEVRDVTHIRAVSHGGVTLSSYLARGYTADGNNWAVGFTLALSEGKVFGVY